MTDVRRLLVAGAGGGLVGALRGAQLALDVVVVEASPRFRRGNNTSMSTAMVPGAGTRFQRAAGLIDSPEIFVADVVAKTHGAADPTLTQALADVSARLVEWLADDLDVRVELVTDFEYPGHSVCRCHTVPGRSGAALLGMLADRVALAGIDLLTSAVLTDVSLTAAGSRRRSPSPTARTRRSTRTRCCSRPAASARTPGSSSDTSRRYTARPTTAASGPRGTRSASAPSWVRLPPSWTPTRATVRSPSPPAPSRAGPP